MSLQQGKVKTCSAIFMLSLFFLAWTGDAGAVPSFARQTGMSCAACHTVYPELTSFGRRFKLNGYVMGSAKKVSEKDSKENTVLEIPETPPFSAMLQLSNTFVTTSTDTLTSAKSDQKGAMDFPEQFSFFYAGEISPQMGAFVQVTYDSGRATCISTIRMCGMSTISTLLQTT